MSRRMGRGGLAVVGISMVLAGCGGVSIAAPGPGPAPGAARGVPGFDTREFPGESALTTWRESSPYRWLGFYLPAPCYTGTTWQGKRASLRSMGWGLAVLFVGEQDWPVSAGEPSDSVAPADSAAAGVDPVLDAGPRCTRDNLDGATGREHGRAAAGAAAAEGFPGGTVVFLDVERVDTVSAPLAAYVRGWTEGVVADGRYEPGLYAHARNVDALVAVMDDVVAGDAGVGEAGGGASDGPSVPLWVASPNGFSLRRAPGESGFTGAAIWQGRLDATESWGGVTLRIDANVAASADPSG